MQTMLIAAACIALTARSNGEVQTQTVDCRQGDTTLRGFLAHDDAAKGKRPGVLVAPEWWGLASHPKRSAERLAELGYVALAIDIYGEGKVTQDRQQAGQWAGEMREHPEIAAARFRAELDTIRANPRVDPTRIAAIGYCSGGTVCLEMARMGTDLVGVVSFHGQLATQVPKEQRKLRARVLACHGADDPVVPPPQVQAFEQEMRECGADWQLIAYDGAVHSFTSPDTNSEGARHNERAARRSWEAMKQSLAEAFGGATS